jgi:hypothetical protein
MESKRFGLRSNFGFFWQRAQPEHQGESLCRQYNNPAVVKSTAAGLLLRGIHGSDTSDSASVGSRVAEWHVAAINRSAGKVPF